MISLFSRLGRWIVLVWFVITPLLYQREASHPQAISPPSAAQRLSDSESHVKKFLTGVANTISANALYEIGKIEAPTYPLLYSMIRYPYEGKVDEQVIRKEWAEVLKELYELKNSDLMDVVKAFQAKAITLWRLPGTLMLHREGQGEVLFLGRGSSTLAAVLVGSRESGYREADPDSPWKFLADTDLVGFVMDGQLYVGLNPTFQTFGSREVPFLFAPSIGETNIQAVPRFAEVRHVVWLNPEGSSSETLMELIAGGKIENRASLPLDLFTVVGFLPRIGLPIPEEANLEWFEKVAAPLVREKLMPEKRESEKPKPPEPIPSLTFTTPQDACRYLLINPVPGLTFSKRFGELARAGQIVDAQGEPLPETRINSFRLYANALDRVAKSYPEKTVTLEFLQEIIPSPPKDTEKPLTKASALVTLLSLDNKPASCRWNDILRLSSIAYPEYEPFTREIVMRYLQTLDYSIKSRYAGALKYGQIHHVRLGKIADERYFSKLPKGASATLPGLTVAMLKEAEPEKGEDGGLPRFKRGPQSKESTPGLSITSFLGFFNTLAEEYFKGWVKEWNQKGSLAILGDPRIAQVNERLRKLAAMPKDQVQLGIDLSPFLREKLEYDPKGLIGERMDYSEIARRINAGEPLHSIEGLAPVDTPIGRIDLNLLKDCRAITSRLELAKLLEVAHWVGVIEIADFHVRMSLQSEPIELVNGVNYSHTWSDVFWIESQARELDRLAREEGLEGEYRGKKLSEIVADIRGEVWFFEQIFRERIKGKKLGLMYAALPEELKGRDGLLKNWRYLGKYEQVLESMDKETKKPPKFSTPEDAIRYLLENPDPTHSLRERLGELVSQNRLVDYNGNLLTDLSTVSISYRFLMDDVEQFFADLPKEERTLARLRLAVSEPPQDLDKVTFLESFIESEKSDSLTLRSFLRLWGIAYSSYQKIVDQNLINFVNFLDDLDNPPKNLQAQVRRYYQKQSRMLATLAEERYFSKLPQPEKATLNGLIIAMLKAAKDKKISKSHTGTVSIESPQETAPLSVDTFLSYLPTLIHENFKGWIQEWKQTGELAILATTPEKTSLPPGPKTDLKVPDVKKSDTTEGQPKMTLAQIFQQEVGKLISIGLEGEYKGHKVSELVKDNEGQVLFDELALGRENLSGVNLKTLFDLLPGEEKERGLFKDWKELDIPYEAVVSYLTFLKEYEESELERASELADEITSSTTTEPRDKSEVVLNLTEKGKQKLYKWSEVHAYYMEQVHQGKNVRIPDNLWAKTVLGRGRVMDPYLNSNGSLNVRIKGEVHPCTLTAEPYIYMLEEPLGQASLPNRGRPMITHYLREELDKKGTEVARGWKLDLQDAELFQGEDFKITLNFLLGDVWSIHMPDSAYVVIVMESRYSKEGQEWIKIEDLRGLVKDAMDEVKRRTTAGESESKVKGEILGLFKTISSKDDLETAILRLMEEEVPSKSSTKIKSKDLITQSL